MEKIKFESLLMEKDRPYKVLNPTKDIIEEFRRNGVELLAEERGYYYEISTESGFVLTDISFGLESGTIKDLVNNNEWNIQGKLELCKLDYNSDFVGMLGIMLENESRALVTDLNADNFGELISNIFDYEILVPIYTIKELITELKARGLEFYSLNGTYFFTRPMN